MQTAVAFLTQARQIGGIARARSIVSDRVDVVRVQLPPRAAQDTFEAIGTMRTERVLHCPRADALTFRRNPAAPKMRLRSSPHPRLAGPAPGLNITVASAFVPRFFDM